MRLHRFLALGVILVSLVLGSFRAECGEVTLTLDNDFFAGFDRHYTNGFQVAVLADTASLPHPIAGLHPFGTTVDRQFTFAIGQRIYTPSDQTAASPEADDRPYAGWLYVLAEFRRRQEAALDHFMVSLGAVGPASLARPVQNLAHRIIGADLAKGWPKQIHNEPALLLAYERAWPRMLTGRFNGLQVDVTPRVGGTVGNVLTYASAGALARIGSGLPDDFPATHISLGPPRDGYRARVSSLGWYLWAGTDARIVARNIFLDGNTFRASPSVERKPFVWDAQVGAVATWGRQRLGFSLVRRSAEFTTQGRADKFGQLTYSFAY